MNKKKFAIISIIAVIIITIFIGLTSACNQFNDYSKILNANWGFGLPSKAHCSEIYSKDSGASFNGDGIRYHVYSYEEEKPISEMFNWNDNEEKSIFTSSYKESIDEWLNSIDVPSKEFPNYSDRMYWYKTQSYENEIIVLWDASSKKIYIVESFI